jgi:YD repeat-containing protein
MHILRTFELAQPKSVNIFIILLIVLSSLFISTQSIADSGYKGCVGFNFNCTQYAITKPMIAATNAFLDRYNTMDDCVIVLANDSTFIKENPLFTDNYEEHWGIEADCKNGTLLASTMPFTSTIFEDRCRPGYHWTSSNRCVIGEPEPLAAKTNGKCTDCPKPVVANPINLGTGNKFQTEVDYTGNSPFPLTFQRFYNSDSSIVSARSGQQWRHHYDRSLDILGASTIDALREDGKTYQFARTTSGWITDPDVTDTLEELTDGQGTTTGWRYKTAADIVEEYNVNGQLISLTNRAGQSQTLEYEVTAANGGDDNAATLDRVVDSFGRSLNFTYDSNGRIAILTDPAGSEYSYAYDVNGNLTSLTYPDETPADSNDNPQRLYHYEDTNFIYALTGITDENGNRFASWGYDSQGRAYFSEHASGVERVDIVYNADGTTTATDSAGEVQTYSFSVQHGVALVANINGNACADCGSIQSATYDANGFFASRTDFNGNQTTYINDARGLQTSRTEAVGTLEERTITTEWHASFRLPTKITEPGKETAFSYDASGRLLSRTETDTVTLASRTSTNSYYAASDFGGDTSDPRIGLLKSIDGPRIDLSDITDFEYDVMGNLIKTSNALGQETNITSHDAHGRPLTIVDANGTQTTLSYDARGRLLTRTVDGDTTTFEYDGVGNISKTTLPNGSFLLNTYDAAQRLIAVEDNLGNRIDYTLDAFGNRTKEDVKDPLLVLTRTLSRTYSSLNRLIDTLGGANQSTTFNYDANGNQIDITVDPSGLNQLTSQAYDALNRLSSTTDAKNGITSFAYDDRDNLISVTDPTGLVTNYSYDGLDNLTQQISPDTGTSNYNYDEAGNRLSQTDARGVITSFNYDALNRLSNISYPDSSQNVTFTYDSCTNGIGRLCAMTDASGNSTTVYDGKGNLIAHSTTMGAITQTVSYAYNSADQLTLITYPSGRMVNYQRNALGQIDSVSTTQGTQTNALVTAINYAPFGPMTALTYGNGLSHSRSYDLDYRLTSLITGTLQDLGYDLDGANNITGITNNLDVLRSQSFVYDELNRLTDATGVYGDIDYGYDANGNRTTKTIDTYPETYTYDTLSHQLQQTVNGGTRTYSYDANGNTTDNTDRQFSYGDNNRLKTADVLGSPLATYTYNGRGERVMKDGSETTLYYYDQAGQLLAELDGLGNTLTEYIYVDGLMLAQLKTGAANTLPTVSITVPANDAVFTAGDNITFTGTATDTEDGDLGSSLQWSSDVDGVLGTGVSVSTTSLSVNNHIITASVTDSGNLTGTATINLTVTAANTPPTVSIVAPADGSTHLQGDNITFTGTATDAEDGDLSATIQWTSSLDGSLGSGASISTTTLSVGSHVITASATDSNSEVADDTINISVADTTTTSTITGTSGDDLLIGTSANELILGLGGHDELRGHQGNDTLQGGPGNDVLSGHEGNDTYVFELNWGTDVIDNNDYGGASNIDTIQFGAGINPSDITLMRDDDNLFLQHSNGDSIMVRLHFFYTTDIINRIVFADGTVWDEAAINAMLPQPTTGDDTLYGTGYGDDTIDGLAGNDNIRTSNGDDTLIGGLGDDLLTGHQDNDTYQFGPGWGQDTISNQDWSDTNHTNVDTIAFLTGISPSDISVSKDDSHQYVTHVSTGDKVTVWHAYTYATARTNRITFADGTEWDNAAIEGMMAQSTSGDDTLFGSYSIANQFDDTIDGLAGDDHINSGTGDDTLIGNSGDDWLSGRTGDDTYVFDVGWGQDIISNYDYWSTSVDIVRFGVGIAPADISVSLTGTTSILLGHSNGTDQIILSGYYSNNAFKVDRIEFADGTVWDQATLEAMANGGGS